MPLLRSLATCLGLLCASAPAGAQEDLHCLLVDVPIDGLFLMREEMKLAAPPAKGEAPPLFSTDGNPRKVLFRGQAAMAGVPRAKLGSGPGGTPPAERGINENGITIAVEKVPGPAGPCYFYDVAMLLDHEKKNYDPALRMAPITGRYLRFHANGQSVPVTPNVWQEVASWIDESRTVMLWQYVAMPDPPALGIEKDPTRKGPDPQGHHAVDVIFGVVPPSVAEQVHRYTARQCQLAAESLLASCNQWKHFGLHARPGTPFLSQSAHGERKRIAEPGYDASCAATLGGTLMIGDSGTLTLAGDLKAASTPGGEMKSYPFRSDVVPGEWKIQQIVDGPRYWWTFPVFPTRWAGGKKGIAEVNVVVFRVRDEK